MNYFHKLQHTRMSIPQKTLTEIAYALNKAYKKPNKKLTSINISDIKKIIKRDNVNDWINRLLKSSLLLKGNKKGHYLIYPPHIFFRSYDSNPAVFVTQLIKNLFDDIRIITSDDISPHTRDGFSSQEIYVILDNLETYEKIHNSLVKNNAFFLYVPGVKNKPKKSLMAYALFVRADSRALIAMFEIYEKMSSKEKHVFIELVCKSTVPVLLTDFVLSALDYPQKKITPTLEHHKFSKDYELSTINGGYSMALFYQK